MLWHPHCVVSLIRVLMSTWTQNSGFGFHLDFVPVLVVLPYFLTHTWLLYSKGGFSCKTSAFMLHDVVKGEGSLFCLDLWANLRCSIYTCSGFKKYMAFGQNLTFGIVVVFVLFWSHWHFYANVSVWFLTLSSKWLSSFNQFECQTVNFTC